MSCCRLYGHMNFVISIRWTLSEIGSLVCQKGEKTTFLTIFCGYLHSDINFHYHPLQRAHKGNLQTCDLRGSHNGVDELWVFCKETPCALVNRHQLFRSPCCVRLQWYSTAHIQIFILCLDRWRTLNRREVLEEGRMLRCFPVSLELTSGLGFATGSDVSADRLFLQMWITTASDEDLNDPSLPHRALDDKAMNNVFPQWWITEGISPHLNNSHNSF
jgi:hypothetical protein